jgi:hypothetical protein
MPFQEKWSQMGHMSDAEVTDFLLIVLFLDVYNPCKKENLTLDNSSIITLLIQTQPDRSHGHCPKLYQSQQRCNACRGH